MNFDEKITKIKQLPVVQDVDTDTIGIHKTIRIKLGKINETEIEEAKKNILFILKTTKKVSVKNSFQDGYLLIINYVNDRPGAWFPVVLTISCIIIIFIWIIFNKINK